MGSRCSVEQSSVEDHGHRPCDIFLTEPCIQAPATLIVPSDAKLLASTTRFFDERFQSQQTQTQLGVLVEDWELVMDGVHYLNMKSSEDRVNDMIDVGVLSVHLPHAIPLFCDADNNPIVALSRYGQGKVVAFGHPSCLCNQELLHDTRGTWRLLHNIFNWMVRTPKAQNRRKPGEHTGHSRVGSDNSHRSHRTNSDRSHASHHSHRINSDSSSHRLRHVPSDNSQASHRSTRIFGKPHRSISEVVDIRPPKVLCYMTGSRSLFSDGHFNVDYDHKNKLSGLSAYDIVIVRDTDITESNVDVIEEFVIGGGGLLVGGCGYLWAQCGKPLSKLYANSFLGNLGILYTYGRSFQHINNTYPSQDVEIEESDTGIVFSKLHNIANGRSFASDDRKIRRMFEITLRAANATPPHKLLSDALQAPEVTHTPSPRTPVFSTMWKDKCCIFFQQLRWKFASVATKVSSGPGVEQFPGVPTGDRVTVSVDVDTSIPGWHSTGVYAVPGELVTISVTGNTIPCGCMEVLVGCHTDVLWSQPQDSRKETSWKRWPQLSLAVGMNAITISTTNRFGGLVYVRIDSMHGKHTHHNRMAIFLVGGGVVAAPIYRLHKTSQGEWQQQLKNATAPWGELEGERVVISLPLEQLKSCNPEQLLTYWDSVVKCYEDLHRPTVNKRGRKERLVFDVQPKIEPLHPGYPCVLDMSLLPRLIEAAEGQGPGDYELMRTMAIPFCHRAWTLPGDEELIADLLVVYAYECLFHLGPQYVHDDLKDYQVTATKALLTGFGEPQPDPFHRLSMYLFLRNEFSWEIFRQVIFRYTRTHFLDLPRNQQEIIDEFVTVFSQVTGVNLVPFFKAWGICVSDLVSPALTVLPRWIPKLRRQEPDKSHLGFSMRQSLRTTQTVRRPSSHETIRDVLRRRRSDISANMVQEINSIVPPVKDSVAYDSDDSDDGPPLFDLVGPRQHMRRTASASSVGSTRRSSHDNDSAPSGRSSAEERQGSAGIRVPQARLPRRDSLDVPNALVLSKIQKPQKMPALRPSGSSNSSITRIPINEESAAASEC